MTPYMLIGAAGSPVAGNIIMFAQGLSSSMNSALREGQSYTDSLGYGVTSATMELALNKLLGATGGVLGKSVLGKTTSNLLQKGLTKIPGSPLVKKLLEFGGERLIAGVGEYTEESLQVYTDALMRNFFFDEHNQLHTRNEEAAYNGWIGFIVGILLGDGNSNATASTQLLDGTAKENLEIVKGLHDAAQFLTENDTQRDLVNDMLANAERLYDGKGGDSKLLQTQVQSVLRLWTETNIAVQGTTKVVDRKAPATTEISLKSIESAPAVGAATAGSPVATQTDTKTATTSYESVSPKLPNITPVDIRTHELLAAQAPSLASVVRLDGKSQNLTPSRVNRSEASAESNSSREGVNPQTYVDPELANVIEAATAGVEGRMPNFPQQQPSKPLDPETARLNEEFNAAIEGRKPNLPVESSTPSSVDENGETEYNQRRRKSFAQQAELFEPAEVSKEASSLIKPGARPYTVFHEANIGETKSRSSHRRRANKELYARLESDSDFRKQLDDMLGYDVMAYMKTGKGALKNPSPDLVWHHPYDTGAFVELVYKSDHQNPLMQDVFHPSKKGGYWRFYSF